MQTRLQDHPLRTTSWASHNPQQTLFPRNFPRLVLSGHSNSRRLYSVADFADPYWAVLSMVPGFWNPRCGPTSHMAVFFAHWEVSWFCLVPEGVHCVGSHAMPFSNIATLARGMLGRWREGSGSKWKTATEELVDSDWNIWLGNGGIADNLWSSNFQMARDFPRLILCQRFPMVFPWFSPPFERAADSNQAMFDESGARELDLQRHWQFKVVPIEIQYIVRDSPIVCLVISQLFAASTWKIPDLCYKELPFRIVCFPTHLWSYLSQFITHRVYHIIPILHIYIYIGYICNYTYPHDASLSFGSTPIINYYLLTIDLYPPTFRW